MLAHKVWYVLGDTNQKMQTKKPAKPSDDVGTLSRLTSEFHHIRRLGSVFILLLVIRLLCALTMRTTFAPDEYYQSLVPTEAMLYHKGFISDANFIMADDLTWEWDPRFYIRGSIYIIPSVLAHMLHIPPRVLQGFLSAAGDTLLFGISLHIKKCLKIEWEFERSVLLVHIFSWVWLYCSSRTLVNVTETSLVILVYWQASKPARLGYKCLFFTIGICVYGRPTSIVPLLLFNPLMPPLRSCISAKAFRPLVCSICLCILADSWLLSQQPFAAVEKYSWRANAVVPNRIQNTCLNFFVVNVLEKRAEVFGQHAWHWYWTEGLLTVLGGFAPLIFLRDDAGLCRPILLNFGVSAAILALITSHKEPRFLLPFLPLLHLSVAANLRSRANLKVQHLASFHPD
jgi:hypothetical protein